MPDSPKPTVGRIVHYVSYGTPGGEYQSECRAAVVTRYPISVHPEDVDLCVLNPEGLFFNKEVHYDGGAEVSGDPACPDKGTHGNPFRYCSCGWMEPKLRGGTWHWPERS